MFFFHFEQKQFPKDQNHNALSVTNASTSDSNAKPHICTVIRCPRAPLMHNCPACPRTGGDYFFDCTWPALFSPISGLFNGGKTEKSSKLRETTFSQSKSSNMLEENIGAPCSLKYASSASNMPQIADQENASNIFKYIASQSASRLA